MTPQEVADHIRRQAADAGMTVEEFAWRINHATKEEIAQAMEQLPTDALEWAVRFEALSHRDDHGKAAIPTCSQKPSEGAGV